MQFSQLPTVCGQTCHFDFRERLFTYIYRQYNFGFIDLYSRKLFTYYATSTHGDTNEEDLVNNIITLIRASNPNATIVFLHSDLGQLDSQVITKFCLLNGINVTFMLAYTPE